MFKKLLEKKGFCALLCLQLVIVLYLQSQVWFSDNGIFHSQSLSQQIEDQEVENSQLGLRNDLLSLEIAALQNGGEAVEGRARLDLGMIKENETFFLVTQ